MMSPLGLRTLDIVTEDRQIDPLTAERLKRRSFGALRFGRYSPTRLTCPLRSGFGLGV